MTPAPFPNLFQPFGRGRLNIANRLAILPHGTSMVKAGVPTEDDLAYYAARAKGVGLVITGAMVAHPQAVVRERNRVETFNPLALEALRRRTEVVHALGAKIVGQLNHVGRETVGSESEFAPVGATARRASRDPYPPHALEDREILTLIDGFAQAAVNLKSTGYDGAELHAAHGYLFAQFLSPATNHRTDRWGGTPEKRLRLVRETAERIRERCGEDFIIGVRLSADEEVADGLEVRDTVGIGQALAGAGTVDYLNITLGVRGGYVKDATAPVAPAARAAGIIRKECGLPVILGQKIQTPELAEKLLEEGAADIIGMARAFIADPDFATKARSGRSDRIRPCVGLNQDCRSFNPHIHCALNPETGRELRPDFGPARPAQTPRRVAVIGGGPAGMEAARLAALRGHKVTLFEASEALGGQFLIAASVPNRGGLLRMVDHLIHELRHGAVEVRLNTPVNDLDALASDFDAAILATGATPAPLSLPSGGIPTMTWAELLRDGAPAPSGNGEAVFADDGLGFWFSYGAAEKLAEAGWRVTFLTTAGAIGGNLPAESVGGVLARLGRADTSFRVLTGIETIGPAGVTAVNLTSGREEDIPCDLVVMQTGRLVTPLPASANWEARGLALHVVGDCVTPRRISHALFEGQRAARSL